MGSYGSISSFPRPDLTVREADADPIPWTLTAADGETPINLTGVSAVIMRLRPYRGTQAAVAYYSSTPAVSAPIAVVTPTAGYMMIIPTSTMFLASAERYRAYFELLVSGSPRSIPQERDLWIEVLPKMGA